MSSVPKNKQALEHAIELSFNKIFDEYVTIPSEVSRKIGIPGNVNGTLISVSDTLAYLIGWGKLVLKWYRLKESGEQIHFPETGYKWNELGPLAESFHYQYKEWLYTDLLVEFELTTKKILSLIDSLNNEQLYCVPWYEKYTLGKMIQLNTFSPMKSMRTKVRKFKQQNELK